MTARALWAGPGVALCGAGEVAVASRAGGYVRLDDGYVHLAPPRAPRGPLTLLVAGLEPLRPGDRAHVDDALHIGTQVIDLVAPSPPSAPAPLRPGRRAALRAALAATPAPPAWMAPGLAALRAGDLEAAVAALAGRGDGLTPAGDDVLAGYAAWSGGALSPLAAGASPIGLAYLRCAERGELPEVVARVVAAIRAGDAEAARRRARALSRWGSSSGAAILWGVASAL